MKTRILASAALVEVAYILISRFWLRGTFADIDLEIATTALRLACAAILWILIRKSPDHRPVSIRPLMSPLAVVGIAILLAIPAVTQDTSPVSHTAVRFVFALTSIAVAVREEFFYRGILQRWIADRAGAFPAIICSNVVFTIYHLGDQWLFQVFVVGCVLGLIYAATRSLIAVVAVHATYDALWALSPFLLNVLQGPWVGGLMSSSLAVMIVWFVFVRRAAGGRAEKRGSHAG